MAGQFWMRKGDHEDEDEKIAKPFAEYVGHGNMEFPLKHKNDDCGTLEKDIQSEEDAQAEKI